MIQILDEALVNKIAAGEVVERPVHIVKELVENAIDARAMHISIDVGENLILVTDDGDGMSKEDLEKSVLRHATSKIKIFDDLQDVATYGFRGEALASIAAVSDLTITTRQREALEGYTLRVEGGIVRSLKNIGCSPGTTVCIQDLFFNTPVRKKFLDTHEFERIVDFLEKFAMGTTVALRLRLYDKVVLEVNADTLLDRIVQVYGLGVPKHLAVVAYDADGIKMNGYVSKPSLLKRDRSMQSVFVNGRLVESEEVNMALYDAYKSLLFVNKHPLAVLCLDVKDVDVNVHPTKKIVKFSSPDKISRAVFDAIRSVFREEKIEFSFQETFAGQMQLPLKENKYFQLDSQKILAPMSKEQSGYIHFPPLRLLGNVAKTFFLAESPQGLVLIDQHVVEERINYEMFMDEYMRENVSVQELLQPEILELTQKEMLVVQQSVDLLRRFGFSLDEFGDVTFRLRTVPVLFSRVKGVDLLKDLLIDFKEAEKEKIVTRMACRSAIKAGDSVSNEQMYSLLKKLDQCELPYTCPHGRPTMITVSVDDVEKMFRRKGF